jgi:hypothetical protein
MANPGLTSRQKIYSVGLVPYVQNPNHPGFSCVVSSEEGFLLPFSAERINNPEGFGRLCLLGMLNQAEDNADVDPATTMIVAVEELRDANGDPLSPAVLTQSLYIGRVAFAGENHPGVENFSWSPENRSPGEEYADLVKEFVDNLPQEDTIDAGLALEKFAENRGISLEVMRALLVSARVPTPWSMKLASDDSVEIISYHVEDPTNLIHGIEGSNPKGYPLNSDASYIF